METTAAQAMCKLELLCEGSFYTALLPLSPLTYAALALKMHRDETEQIHFKASKNLFNSAISPILTLLALTINGIIISH